MLTAMLLAAGIIAVHPEGNPNARLLTVEEAVSQSSRSVYPETIKIWWDSDSRLTNEKPAEEEPSWTLPEGNPPEITYGQTVSRNEFGGSKWAIPSPDGNFVAVYRNDQSAVGTFPLFDITTRSGSTREIKYPMAGMPSEKLAICICLPDGTTVTELKVTDFDGERYLTNPCWSEDSKYLFVQVLDRAQHNMKLNMYNAYDGTLVRTILSEHNDAWVEPLDPLYFLKDGSGRFIYRTDNRDGYRNLYLCDTSGSIERITPCSADVAYIANDGEYVYYTSAEVSPAENHLFRVRINGRRIGKPERITFEEGWHEIDMAPDCSKFIDRYSSFNVPGMTLVKNSDGSLIQKVLEAIDPLDEYAQCRVELGSVPSADGKFSNSYRLFYPRGYDPSKQYPLIVYVYGGPHSQMVRNSWLGNIRMWEMLMAQKGYFVYVQDNRGTSNRGAAYEKAINRSLGEAETADQLKGIRELLDRVPAIDRSRIGVHGWSYGGFMALNLATARPDMFKVTVAGGPVIDWKWYEVMYGERYMDTPQTNPEGYEAASLLNKAADISGRVLICQGVLDDTVVWQHALNFIQKCIEAEKPVDWFAYPMEKHNMMGRARVHLYEKITDYFETYL